MSSIALQSSAFNQEEFDDTSRQPDNVHQKETLLKKLIRKGHHSCELFLQKLARSGYEEKVKICLSEHIDDDTVNDQLNNVTSEKIEQNLDYITSNLEIGNVLDMLFERQLITIDEHDEVQRKVTKPEKKRTLLSLLLSRPDTNWLFGFIRVLHNTGHINLLERLRQHVSNDQELPELPYRALGHTVPFDFIARFSSTGNSIQSEEMDDNDLQMAQQVFQGALDMGLIEIRKGSIYFYLSTFSPDKILAILNGKDDANLMKFLQLLFSKNKYLLRQFPKDTDVKFELEEKPDTLYGRWKSQISTNKDEFCSGCYQTKLRANYKTVLDEIEEDIIQDTLKRLEKVEKPKYQLHSSQSLLRNKTRSEKAFTFLQYVLGNEHVLSEFSKAFEYHSQVELKGVKCRNCSSPEDQIEITNIEKELVTPSVALRPILDDKTAAALRTTQKVQQDRRPTLTEFMKEGKVKLKYGTGSYLTDMAVTSDNKLLLCNEKPCRVYIYKDCKTYEDNISLTYPPWCITVVPCTDKAVVTLPGEESIQFINTTNNTKDNKIKIGEVCRGVTAVKDNIYIGVKDKVLILNTDGSRVREITTDGGVNYYLLYDERNDQLLLRQMKRLCCINLDGHVIYRYNISGDIGLAVDQQGHVYISGYDSHDIHRLSPDGTFRDIVLSKHDGVDRPWSITFNNDFTKLFIINRGETVLVCSCK